MQFILKIYPNIQFHLGGIVCAEIGNCTTAQPQVLKETYDPFLISDTSVYMSVMELARNNHSKLIDPFCALLLTTLNLSDNLPYRFCATTI